MNDLMFPKHKRIRSKKLRDSARGQSCFVRLPGICNFNDETTVLAHLGNGGMGAKQDDLFGSFCCSSCHDHIDSRVNPVFDNEFLKNSFYDGMIRTQKYWLYNGLIKFK